MRDEQKFTVFLDWFGLDTTCYRLQSGKKYAGPVEKITVAAFA
jgi:hypothetical protein